MTNQTGIGTLLEKLKQSVKEYQRTRTVSLQAEQQLNALPDEIDVDENLALSLEVGNELLITIDILKIVSGLSKNALGRVVIIDQLMTNQENDIKASAFGIQVNVDLKIARQMRTAYLRREQAWT